MRTATRRSEPAGWPGPTTPVLVVVVNHPTDLARARDEGWYRLPVAHAPTRLGCEALALYQTGVFGAAGRRVGWWARVTRIVLARRRELIPTEPGHPRAEAWYYCFVLGPLTALPRPILARRLRRVTFIPTTWGRLQTAEDVAQLWLHEDGRVTLAEGLKEMIKD